ncbi:MAG TPA: hypothetical protein ENI06_11055 [Spirochaetales bacterium]|nr:hypothetical protein [Spirochaetales bacterium]
MKIFDEENRELKQGEVGEIVIRGGVITRGYYNAPEETEKAMQGGWFHSGDLGYCEEEGYFFITDRKKDLIIRGGFNISPREVEEIIHTLSKVKEVAVIGVHDKSMREAVKAFVVLKEGESSSVKEIVDFCKDNLSSHKVPEFIYSFFALQKLGVIAVPFNTMYKGREIIHILNDCGAKAIIALSNFASLINEIKTDVASLEHVILTGERTLLFVHPESTISVQMVYESGFFESADQAYQKVGEILVETLKNFGVAAAWYKHRGSIRVNGRKIASFIISQVENLTVMNALCFLGKLKTDDFFKVIWVPAEIKDKILEPLTSVEEVTGAKLDKTEFKNTLGIEIEEGPLKRDELFAYEKQRALAHKT